MATKSTETASAKKSTAKTAKTVSAKKATPVKEATEKTATKKAAVKKPAPAKTAVKKTTVKKVVKKAPVKEPNQLAKAAFLVMELVVLMLLCQDQAQGSRKYCCNWPSKADLDKLANNDPFLVINAQL